MKAHRFLLLNGALGLALLGARWGASTEASASGQIERIQKDFLHTLQIPFQNWKTTDAYLTPSEMDQLQPDAVLVRRYRSSKGEFAEIAVVAGHQKKSVHTPAYCMPSDGLEIISQEACDLPLSGQKISANRMLMGNSKGEGLLVTYFFTDGDLVTGNLVKFQGNQLLKRFRSQIPLGALIRIIVPVEGSPAKAAQLSDRFAQATAPAVMERLRQVRAGRKV
jgi:EpsI family protein